MTRTRPEPLGPLAQLAAAEALTHSTSLRLRAGLRLRLEPDGERVTLVLLGRTVSIPAHAGEALKAVLSGADFTPAELPGLDDADQLMVARRLVREGVVVPA
jgi:hypothetical protein